MAQVASIKIINNLNEFDHSKTGILFVEGIDECNVIRVLLQKYDINSENIVILNCRGKENLTKILAQFLHSDEYSYQYVGIILDVDDPKHDGIQACLQSIQNIFNKQQQHYDPAFNYRKQFTAKKITDTGLVIKPQNYHLPHVGVWLMPNNKDNGMLEDFLMKLLNSDLEKNAIEFAKKCVEEAQTKGFASYKPTHQSKAIIHTYLSWQDPTGAPFSQALQNKTLKHDAPLAQNFIHWLKDTFAL